MSNGARIELLRDLAGGVSTEDIARVLRAFPHLISEAVRELNGEVEYKMLKTKPKKA
jgi:uncharacterized protein YqhQ